MMPTLRPSLLFLLAMIGVLGCKTSSAPSDPAPSEDTSNTQKIDDDLVFDASTPAGQKMAWLIELINTPDTKIDAELLDAHFSPVFFAQVPHASLISILEDVRAQLNTLTPQKRLVVHPHDMTLIALNADEQPWVVSLAVSRQEPHLIEGLFFQPAPREKKPAPTTFAELDARLGELGQQAHALIARVDPDSGSCEPIHQLDADTAYPLASSFKLYVLFALARQIDAGKMAWDDLLAIRDDLKSLPTGSMQHHEAGKTFALSTYAESMISISDNTATDHLMWHLGPETLGDAVKASNHHAPELLDPMLTTQELFKLKLTASEEQVSRFIALDSAGRRTFRKDVLATMPQIILQDALVWKGPRHIDTIEWFASSQDLCTLHGAFVRQAKNPVHARALEVLTLNDAGIGLEKTAWPYVGYKGGAEPGVLTMSWLVKSSSGEWFSVSLALEQTIPQIDESLLVDLGRAAVMLIPQDSKTP